ncbi:uncharacterized protein [Paramormyrops kingsleyae]
MYIGSYIDNYEVSMKNKVTGEVSVRAVCHRSMRKSEKPHDLRMVLNHSKPVVLLSTHCSCVAGSALCNHLVALLYQTAHYSQLNIPAVPPVHSCTDTEQIWHKPRTLGVRPGPVGQMEIRNPRNSTTDCIRSSLYKALDGEMPNLAMLRVSEVYKDFTPSFAPLVTTMGMSAAVPLVQSAFGPVQAGSVLSFQQKQQAMREIINIPSAPALPSLPIDSYRLEPPSCAYVLSAQEHLHLKSLEVSFNMAHRIEAATKGQSSCQEWHRLRRLRVTSTRFHEICHVGGHTSAENLAERIFRGTGQTQDMRRGIDMEPLVVKEYCVLKNANYSPCGFIVHPDAPWLGSSPDGVIFDPSGNPPFGLLDIKCPNVQSYVDCPYIKMIGGALKLKRQHKYYCQVQGQMLLTGLEWCDFVVCAQEDMLVERIYKDLDIMQTIRDRADYFFFYHYIQKCLQ